MATAKMRKATATRGPRQQTNVPDAAQAVANSQRYRAVGLARNGVPKHPIFGTPTDDSDPAEVLLEEIRRTAGTVRWLQERIYEVDPDRFVKSLWLRGRQSGFIKDTEFDQFDWSAAGALWVELYQSERKHLAGICRTALAAGIEERRVRIAERMAETITDAIRGMLYDLNLDPEDDAVRTVVYRHLMHAQGLVMEERSRLAIDP
jgi:hypothetical protein